MVDDERRAGDDFGQIVGVDVVVDVAEHGGSDVVPFWAVLSLAATVAKDLVSLLVSENIIIVVLSGADVLDVRFSRASGATSANVSVRCESVLLKNCGTLSFQQSSPGG